MQTHAVATTHPIPFHPLTGTSPALARARRRPRLADFWLFEGISAEAVAELESVSHTKVVDKGGYAFLPGEDASSVYFLVSGRVKIARLSDEGKEFILELVEPGESFGETGALDGAPRETVAEALERATVLVVPSARLRQTLACSPRMLMRLTEFLGGRQRRLEKRLVDVAHRKAPQRLAELLVELGESYGIRDARGTLLRIKLSQSALGNLLGVSREIVNHTVAHLRRRGIIDVAEGRVIIRDPEALAAAARWPRAETPRKRGQTPF